MVNTLGIALNAGMGEQILTRLSGFCDLPTEGLLAGQAVASAVSELFGDGRAAKYNDVDLFRGYRHNPESQSTRAKREELRALHPCAFEKLDIELESLRYDEYSHMALHVVPQLKFQKRKTYRVIKTSRQGLLNIVECAFSRAESSILDSFDLNCVQVGVDLQTKKLLWTPAYARFLATHQMEIVHLHTPFHSLIRYLKKKRELEGVYGNDARMLELVALACELDREWHPKPREKFNLEQDNLRWRFGAIYKKHFEVVQSELAPHFDLVTEKVREHDVFRLVPRFEVDKDLREVGRRHQDIQHQLPLISRALREPRKKGAQSRLSYVAEQVEPTITVQQWHSLGDDYLSGNVTPAELARLDDLVSEYNLHSLMVSLTLVEQVEFIKALDKEAAARGKWVYGVLESRIWNHPGWLNDIEVAPAARSAVMLKNLLDEYEVLLNSRLTEPLLLQQSIKGHQVRELCTGMELVLEGMALHHCVGGYACAVEADESRIFSLRRGSHVSGWLTLELAYDDIVQDWKIGQLKGLLNRAPSEAEMQLAESVLDRVRMATWSTAQFVSQLAPSTDFAIFSVCRPRRAWQQGEANFGGKKPTFVGKSADVQ